jgi:DNA-binding MarR family transcriptional regulator
MPKRQHKGATLDQSWETPPWQREGTTEDVALPEEHDDSVSYIPSRIDLSDLTEKQKTIIETASTNLSANIADLAKKTNSSYGYTSETIRTFLPEHESTERVTSRVQKEWEETIADSEVTTPAEELHPLQRDIIEKAINNPKKSLTELSELVGCSLGHVSNTINEHFPTYNQGREGERYTDATLSGDIRAVAVNLGRFPTTREYRQQGNHSLTTIHRRLGKWDDALESTGLDFSKPSSPTAKIPDEELKQDILSVSRELDRPPNSSEYLVHGKYHLSTVRDRFGSMVEAVESVGLSASEIQRRSAYPPVSCKTKNEIARRYQTEDVTQSELAAEYDVSQPTVHDAIQQNRNFSETTT